MRQAKTLVEFYLIISIRNLTKSLMIQSIYNFSETKHYNKCFSQRDFGVGPEALVGRHSALEAAGDHGEGFFGFGDAEELGC